MAVSRKATCRNTAQLSFSTSSFNPPEFCCAYHFIRNPERVIGLEKLYLRSSWRSSTLYMNNKSTGKLCQFLWKWEVCEPFNVILIDQLLLSVQRMHCDFSQSVRPWTAFSLFTEHAMFSKATWHETAIFLSSLCVVAYLKETLRYALREKPEIRVLAPIMTFSILVNYWICCYRGLAILKWQWAVGYWQCDTNNTPNYCTLVSNGKNPTALTYAITA